MTGPLEIIRGVLQGNSVRWVLSSTFELSDGTTIQQDVLFNVTRNYTRDWPGAVTDRPVENADNITDNVRREPQRIDCTILLTPDTSGIKLASLLKTNVDERAELLMAWRDTATILTLTGRQIIENILIESLVERKSSDISDSRMFDIVLRQVNIADTDAASEAGVGTRELQTEETPI